MLRNASPRGAGLVVSERLLRSERPDQTWRQLKAAEDAYAAAQVPNITFDASFLL